jgi:hypothetical protein
MKLVQALVALLLAGAAFAATTSPAWAAPCTRGERLVGSTDKFWICEDIASGSLRNVLK